jgi:hypothetical protein
MAAQRSDAVIVAAMKRVLRYIDSLDRSLRWGLFLPVGLALSFLVSGIVDTAFGMASGPYRTMPGVTESSIAAFIAAATRVLFPAVISPRPWPVGITMFALDFLVRVAPIANMFRYDYMRQRLPALVPQIVPYVLAGVAGGFLGLYLVRLAMTSAAKAQHAIRN